MGYAQDSLEDAQRRAAIAKVYRSRGWADKVKKMSPQQVVAIYLRMKSQGKV